MKKVCVLLLFVFSVSFAFSQAIIYKSGNQIHCLDIYVKNDTVYFDADNTQVQKDSILKSQKLFIDNSNPISYGHYFSFADFDSIVYNGGKDINGLFGNKKECQTYYSPRVFSNARDYEAYNTKIQLGKMYKQYRTGAHLMLGGFICSSVGAFALYKGLKFGTPLLIVRRTLVLTGWIVQVNSNKYLKRASVQYSVSPLSSSIKLVF